MQDCIAHEGELKHLPHYHLQLHLKELLLSQLRILLDFVEAEDQPTQQNVQQFY